MIMASLMMKSSRNSYFFIIYLLHSISSDMSMFTLLVLRKEEHNTSLR